MAHLRLHRTDEQIQVDLSLDDPGVDDVVDLRDRAVDAERQDAIAMCNEWLESHGYNYLGERIAQHHDFTLALADQPDEREAAAYEEDV